MYFVNIKAFSACHCLRIVGWTATLFEAAIWKTILMIAGSKMAVEVLFPGINQFLKFMAWDQLLKIVLVNVAAFGALLAIHSMDAFAWVYFI